MLPQSKSRCYELGLWKQVTALVHLAHAKRTRKLKIYKQTTETKKLKQKQYKVTPCIQQTTLHINWYIHPICFPILGILVFVQLTLTLWPTDHAAFAALTAFFEFQLISLHYQVQTANEKTSVSLLNGWLETRLLYWENTSNPTRLI